MFSSGFWGDKGMGGWGGSEGVREKLLTSYQLPITHYPLPITHYPFPTLIFSSHLRGSLLRRIFRQIWVAAIVPSATAMET